MKVTDWGISTLKVKTKNVLAFDHEGDGQTRPLRGQKQRGPPRAFVAAPHAHNLTITLRLHVESAAVNQPFEDIGNLSLIIVQ